MGMLGNPKWNHHSAHRGLHLLLLLGASHAFPSVQLEAPPPERIGPPSQESMDSSGSQVTADFQAQMLTFSWTLVEATDGHGSPFPWAGYTEHQ